MHLYIKWCRQARSCIDLVVFGWSVLICSCSLLIFCYSQIRSELEMQMVCNLREFKEFIDNEMIVILGQMDSPTEIFDHVYLVRLSVFSSQQPYSSRLFYKSRLHCILKSFALLNTGFGVERVQFGWAPKQWVSAIVLTICLNQYIRSVLWTRC